MGTSSIPTHNSSASDFFENYYKPVIGPIQCLNCKCVVDLRSKPVPNGDWRNDSCLCVDMHYRISVSNYRPGSQESGIESGVFLHAGRGAKWTDLGKV